MKRRLFACLLAGCMMLSLFPAVSAASTGYADVPATSWAAADIAAATEAGLFQGVSANTFGMGKTMTRAQFVTALVRLFGWETVTPATPTFSDCAAWRWYYGAVETAYAHDALPSYATTFRPNDAVTREEMASMLVRALGYTALAGQLASRSLPFSDVTSNKGYIAIAYDLGIITGYADGTFRPKGLATREQVAAVLVRLMKKLQTSSMEVSGGSYISLEVEIPQASADTTVPTTPPQATLDLYEALRICQEKGTDMSRVAVVFTAGGVSTVTRGSSIVSTQEVSRRQVDNYLSRSGVKNYYSDKYDCSYLIYTSGSTQTTIWYQTEESLSAKLALCRLFGVPHYIMQDA